MTQSFFAAAARFGALCPVFVSIRRWAIRLMMPAALTFIFAAAPLYGQEASAVSEAEAKAPAEKAADKPAETPSEQEAIKASLYYPNLDPKQLFQMLSEIYHVQFEGVDTVTGPISLISKETEMVDVDGMLLLLNGVLSEQNKITVRSEGQIIRIMPVLDTESKWIELRHADPQKVVEFLRELYSKKKEGELEPPLKVIRVHPELPRIYLVGQKKVLAEVEQMIQNDLDIDTQAPAAPGSGDSEQAGSAPGSAAPAAVKNIKQWIELKYTQPDKVIQFLQNLYRQQLKQGKILTEITSHPEQSKILVVGSPDIIQEITELIQNDIDVAPLLPPPPPLPPLHMKYVSLSYIDVAEFQGILEKDQSLKDKFNAAVAPNNTLVISTREESIFPRIDDLQKTFDVDRLEIRYYPLSNALAEDIAGLLQAIYPDESAEALPQEVEQIRREQLRSPGESASAPLDAELLQAMVDARTGTLAPNVQQLLSQSITIVSKGELTIIPDKVRNGLLIRTFSRNYPKILELIRELDRPNDQVMIDVFITEVQLDNATQFGVDFTYRNDMETNNGRYTIGQDTGTSVSSSGLSYQLISDNISAYIRALQTTGKLDIITRPQVLTKNNIPATIALGKTVPLIDKTTVSTEGATNSTVSYKDVMTQLDVTPQIHPDGFVSLKIKQDINDVGTETFQISKDFNPQVLIKRQAVTELRIKDGQTVCLGGFIGNSINITERKVPFLGDIPLLGELFKYKETSRVKTELVIFITPHVLNTPQELLRMTNYQREQSKVDREDKRTDDFLTVQPELVYPKFADPLPVVSPQDAEAVPAPASKESPAPAASTEPKVPAPAAKPADAEPAAADGTVVEPSPPAAAPPASEPAAAPAPAPAAAPAPVPEPTPAPAPAS